MIPANVAAPIVATFLANNLFIGMKVFDVSSGSPVQVTGKPGQINNIFPMTLIAGSLSYQALFIGLNQHGYLFVIDGYTDGTYTALDGSVPEQSKAEFCAIISPLIVQSIKIRVGCESQPRGNRVTVAQNSDLNLLLAFEDEYGHPVDVTAATALAISILEADGITILTKTLTSGISFVSGYPNQALVALHAADFALLPTGDNDVEIALDINGSNFNFNLYSAINVQPAAV